MPRNIAELLERVYLGSTSQPEKLTPEKREERQLLKTQLLSLGFDLDEDLAFEKWNNAELRELLEALVAAQDGTLEEERRRQQQKSQREEEPVTRVETHIPGVNDLMSGGLPPGRSSSSPSSSSSSDLHSDRTENDDHTVSIDTLPHLYRSMPHYMISVKVLRTLDLFSDPLYYDILPADFFTTVKGLKRAWDEANEAQPDAGEDMDEHLLEGVLKRGGLVENAYWSVKYPCDIVPPNGGVGDPEFWREIREMDRIEDEREGKDVLCKSSR